MTRVARTATAAILALTLGVVPLVADWCASTCEAAHQSHVPSCHQTSSPSPHVGQVPAPCGHDHQPIVVDATTATRAMSRGFLIPVVAMDSLDPAAPTSSTTGARATVLVDRSPSPLPLALASTLRI